jgi:uncharacterized damage-inducible protein DinB
MNARKHFLMLARYHVWATERLLDRHVAPLSDEQYRRDVGLFFKSVHGTLNHLLVAERGLWFERFVNGQSPRRKLNEEVHTDRTELHAALKRAVREWLPAIESWDESRFDGMLAYTSTEGVARTVPFAPALTHVFNHGTHHRGQISAAITALGHAGPEIDLLFTVLHDAAKSKPA